MTVTESNMITIRVNAADTFRDRVNVSFIDSDSMNVSVTVLNIITIRVNETETLTLSLSHSVTVLNNMIIPLSVKMTH